MGGDSRRVLHVVWLQAKLAWEDADLRKGRRHKWKTWPRTDHRSHIMLCLLCSSGCASAMAPGPRDHFYSSVLKGVTVTIVGTSVQVDTSLGRSEPGPTSISIEI